jgi:hypothetical protein
MVPLTSLWVPILVSAVFVFLASFVFHMVLTYHRGDYGKVPSEDQVMDALRKFAIPPGDYFLPNAGSPAAMKTPEYKKKVEAGPLVVMTVMGRDGYAMGKRLLLWFLYSVAVSIIAGYVAGRALGPQAGYRTVFRFVGTVAFACYAVGLWQNSIWYARKWSTTMKSTFDGLVYAMLTAGTFGWLWPR